MLKLAFFTMDKNSYAQSFHEDRPLHSYDLCIEFYFIAFTYIYSNVNVEQCDKPEGFLCRKKKV